MVSNKYYDYRYERDGSKLRCHCCDEEIQYGSYYYNIDNKNYCFNCVNDSKFVAGVD